MKRFRFDDRNFGNRETGARIQLMASNKVFPEILIPS